MGSEEKGVETGVEIYTADRLVVVGQDYLRA
jgi:hypothetical protein